LKLFESEITQSNSLKSALFLSEIDVKLIKDNEQVMFV